MLLKKQALPRSQFTTGARAAVKTPYFIVKVNANNLTYSRLGVVVSGAAVKSSVKRNFLKRQTKAIFKAANTAPSDFIIIFNSQSKALTRKQLQVALRKVFQQI
jgi:ribonuclease P protein component